MLKKLIAEFMGTMTLVLIGCGAVVVAGNEIGHVGIAAAFGLTLVALVYTFGPVSGCHVNPAVSLGAWIAGRIDFKTVIGYVVAQCLGALVGAFILLIIVSGHKGGFHLNVAGLGQTEWKDYGQGSAFLFEAIATFLFVTVILNVTANDMYAGAAGLVIGLTLMAIHLFGIDISGSSLNPARSLGPALMVKGEALHQLWLYFIAPCAGAALAGLLSRLKVFED